MSNAYEVQKQLKNARGKIMLQKTKLEYSKAIIEGLNNNPDMLEKLKDELQMPEEEIWKILSGEENYNIVFYDQALEVVSNVKKK